MISFYAQKTVHKTSDYYSNFPIHFQITSIVILQSLKKKNSTALRDASGSFINHFYSGTNHFARSAHWKRSHSTIFPRALLLTVKVMLRFDSPKANTLTLNWTPLVILQHTCPTDQHADDHFGFWGAVFSLSSRTSLWIFLFLICQNDPMPPFCSPDSFLRRVFNPLKASKVTHNSKLPLPNPCFLLFSLTSASISH